MRSMSLVTKLLEAGLPSDQGIRPHLSVVVGVDTLKGDPGSLPAQLAGFGSIGPKLLGYLGCLSDLMPIVTENGELEQARILNVGRSLRRANRQQRRAITARPPPDRAASAPHPAATTRIWRSTTSPGGPEAAAPSPAQGA